MANIRKTFNFRNGVQVDDDNLIVNQTGLVGIGTSVPTEILDVRGTAKIVGLVTATEVFAGNIRATGVSTFSGGLRVGIVSVGQNGIITATSASGVVTYYGDGGRLLNLPTSQWLDVDIGLGFTSIYAQGFVGVNTTSPRYPFQVGGTDSTRVFESVGAKGVGIDSTGNIYSTGIVTARSYNGIGVALTDLNASNIASGTLDNARLPQNISISGILTATSVVSTNVNINSGGVNVIGVVTATGGFIGNVTGNVVGNVTGTATTATSLSGTPNIVVGVVTATELISNISSTGISTVINRLYVGNNIGLNTTSPTADVHVVKNGIGGVLLTSTQESYVGVARSLTRGEQGGEIRFGNLSDSLSGQTSFDLVNYDIGNINQYIHRGAAGINTGNFNWVYGQNQTTRMTLTWDGKLGIAKTNPDHQLHVVGTSTITNDLYIGDDLFVNGDSSFTGDVTISGNFTTNNLSVLGGISANLNNTSGVSTFFDIDVTNIAELNRVAIQTSTTEFPFQIGQNDNQAIVLSNASFIGIGTTVPVNEVQISAQDAAVIIRAVGVGTTRPRCAVDFYDAGTGYFSESSKYLLPPKVTTAQRNNLSTVDSSRAGALIYNSSTNNLETWTGNTWVSVANTAITPIANFASFAGIASATPLVINLNPVNGLPFANFAQIHDLEIYQFPTNSVGCVTSYGAPFLIGNSAGIGTTTTGTAGQLLQVSGGVYFSGNTGIGTTNPRNNLDVVGNVSITGIVTASQFIRQGGTSSQFLKADGSIDSSTYLTSYTETSTLANVTSRGNLTTNGISVGVVTATRLEVGTGVTVSAGIVTATNGFLSGIGTAVQITTVGNTVVFTVPGVGTTSLTLF